MIDRIFFFRIYAESGEISDLDPREREIERIWDLPSLVGAGAGARVWAPARDEMTAKTKVNKAKPATEFLDDIFLSDELIWRISEKISPARVRRRRERERERESLWGGWGKCKETTRFNSKKTGLMFTGYNRLIVRSNLLTSQQKKIEEACIFLEFSFFLYWPFYDCSPSNFLVKIDISIKCF